MKHAPAPTRRLGWVVGLTSTAYFMVVLDALVVVTALPRMQRDLHIGISTLQWTVNAYGIAFAAGIITAAALGDRFGRRLVFNSGLALFTLASAACALAPGAPELIAARTVQGLGAAVVLPLSLTILTTAYPPEKRGMIVGVYGGLAGLAVALGPIVGGAMTEAIDWHWIFWINVPIGVAAVLLGRQLLPESHGAPERLDLVGVSLVTAAVVALVWALTRAGEAGWGSAEIAGSLTAGCLVAVAFVWWEHRAPEPMVPLRLFASREFAIGNLVSFLLQGGTFAAAFFVTQEFQLARGYSPLGTGLRLLPFFATPMFISPLAGALSDRIGRRPIMIVGLALQAFGFVWVASRGALGTSWIELDAALLVAGLGISMALPTVPTTVLDAVAPHEMGKASGINYMAQRFGTVFALAIASAVFAAHGHLGSGRRHRRIPAGALGVCRFRRPRGPECDRARVVPPSGICQGRAGRSPGRRLNPRHLQAMTTRSNEMTQLDPGIRFPGESEEYRRERNRLLEAEAGLRRTIEEVAAQRRALPRGGVVPDDYRFEEAADGSEVRFSELFEAGKDTLVIYNFMFPRYSGDTRPGPEEGETARLPLVETPCPSCTSILDSLDGAAVHLARAVNLAVVAKSDPERIKNFARERGWRRLRLLSSRGNSFNRDYNAETPQGEQMPLLNVFARDGDQFRHTWASELMYAPREEGMDARHVDSIWPLWNVLDATPHGRETPAGFPALRYG